MNIVEGYSNNDNLNIAFDKSTEKIIGDCTLILFFASSKYDFKKLSQLFKEKYPNTKIVGTTTNGEIGKDINFGEGNLLVIGITESKLNIEVNVIKNIEEKVITSMFEIKESIEKLNITKTSKDSFGLLFVDGLSSSEEKVLAILKPLFGTEFSIVGGSAGDSSLKNTYISYNGEIYQNAAILILVKTSLPFKVYKENIYTPMTEEIFRITKTDNQRTIYEINNEKALDFYARLLGKTAQEVTENDLFYHPLGKIIEEELYITSPMSINKTEKSITFYANVQVGQSMMVLTNKNILDENRKTVSNIKKELQNSELTICFNCVLRYMQMNQERIGKEVYAELSKISNHVIGFTTLGEQYNFKHCNQTLTLITIGGI